MGKIIRFAVLGFGHIGKRHGESIINNVEAELVAVIDVDAELGRSIEKKGFHYFADLTCFLESKISESVDVVVVATPNGLHAIHAIACLNAGKHVIVEKPIALKLKDAFRIRDAAVNNNREVFTVMQNRYTPIAKWLKYIIENEALGDIFLVQVNLFWNRDERYYKDGSWHGTKDLDGGPLFTQFSHFIDLLYWYFGDIKDIETRFRTYRHRSLIEFEDTGLIFFDFVKGGSCSFNYTTSVKSKNLESSITIIAEKGTVKIDGQYMGNLSYCDISNYSFPTLEQNNENGHAILIEEVIDVLKNPQLKGSSLREGTKVVEILEQLTLSMGGC